MFKKVLTIILSFLSLQQIEFIKNDLNLEIINSEGIKDQILKKEEILLDKSTILKTENNYIYFSIYNLVESISLKVLNNSCLKPILFLKKKTIPEIQIEKEKKEIKLKINNISIQEIEILNNLEKKEIEDFSLSQTLFTKLDKTEKFGIIICLSNQNNFEYEISPIILDLYLNNQFYDITESSEISILPKNRSIIKIKKLVKDEKIDFNEIPDNFFIWTIFDNKFWDFKNGYFKAKKDFENFEIFVVNKNNEKFNIKINFEKNNGLSNTEIIIIVICCLFFVVLVILYLILDFNYKILIFKKKKKDIKNLSDDSISIEKNLEVPEGSERQVFMNIDFNNHGNDNDNSDIPPDNNELILKDNPSNKKIKQNIYN